MVDFDLPARGHYATGIAFLSRDPSEAADARAAIDKLAGEEGLVVLGWRTVPISDASLGSISEAAMPSMHQLFVAPAPGRSLRGADPALAIDRLAFVLRKRAEHEIDDCYLVSLSARTITYKGMLTSHQLAEFFPDLSDERVSQRPGPGPLPVLHQHLPVVAPGPPLPVHGPQRGDQHPGREPELDAGPGGAVRLDR